MIALSARQREALDSDHRTLASRTRRRIRIDGEDHTRTLKALFYSGEDGPALVLEGELAERLPLRFEGALVEVDLLIRDEEGPEEVPIRTFTGELLLPEVRGYYTKIRAASSGFWLEKSPLGAPGSPEMEFSGYYPSTALYEALALARVPYAGIDIPVLKEPLFYRVADEAYQWTDKASDVLEAVREDSGLSVWDDARNFATGYMEESLERPGEVAATFTVGVDIKREDYSHSPVFEERYSEVVAYHAGEDGVNRVVGRARIANRTARPPVGAYFPLEVSDPEKGPEEAAKEALRMGSQEEEASFTAAYILPHIARGDTVRIKDEERTREGVYRRSYLVRLATHSHDTDAKRAAYGGVQRVESETYEARAPRSLYRRSPGVVVAPFGEDYLGRPYAAHTLSWVSETEEEGALDVAGAEADGVTITQDEEEAVLDG